MDINLSIIDQHLAGVEDEIREQASQELNITGERLKSLAFVYLCVKTMLDLEPDDAFECLTEGGGDFGVDAIHISIPDASDVTITLLQGKYQHKNLSGNSEFGENAIEKLIAACRCFFDPGTSLQHINKRLEAKIEEIRSLIHDGRFPNIRIIACNNGRKWNAASQERIDRFGNRDRISWEHVNHDVLLNILQKTRPVDDLVTLTGKAVFEDMNYNRVCIGKVAVSEIARLMETHGDRLLERNVRSYLGLHGNRVNEDIQKTLLSNTPSNFYFFNNGLTVICSDLKSNAGFQHENHKVKLSNLQIVNGGQTCMTILKTSQKLNEDGKTLPEDAHVLIRIYELNKDDDSATDTVSLITQATNSQNPVDLRDLHANDEKQRRLGTNIEQLGYHYRRRRMDSATKATDITPGAAAEAILSVWRKLPHQAKFFSREHFGTLYDRIFTSDLNGAQVIIAVLIYRFSENRRRRPLESDPQFVRYASCFSAMLMGQQLLGTMGLSEVKQLDHANFEQAKTLIEENAEAYFFQSIDQIKDALGQLYGADWEEKTSLQQLSATFRRVDLIGKFEISPV